MKRVPRLMAITSGTGEAHPQEGWLERLSAVGVEAIQVREKALDDRSLARLTRDLIRRSDGRFLILVNGRADIALATGADGVHLPSRGLPTRAVRGLLGRSLLLGRSTHALEEIRVAQHEGADYATFSPIFDTPGKGPAVGLEQLERACSLDLPIVALGGLTMDRLDAVWAAGAAGAAAIRMFESPPR